MELDTHVIDKFIDFVDQMIKQKTKRQQHLTDILENESVIKSVRENPNITFILENADKLSSLDETLSQQIEIIKFFYQNQVTDVEQVKVALENIRNNEALVKQEEQMIKSKNEKTQLTNDIAVLSTLKGDKYDSDVLGKVLGISNLTEEEQLIVLTKAAYDSCNTQEKENAPSYIDQYNLVKDDLNQLIKEYYPLIEGKSERELAHTKELVNLIKQGYMTKEDCINLDDFKYYDALISVELLALLDMKKEVENILRGQGMTDYFDIYFMLLQDTKEKIKAIAAQHNEDKKQLSNTNPTNILYLQDVNGNLSFDIEGLNNDQKKGVSNLIDKIQKGLLDYEKGTKKSKYQTSRRLDYSIYIQRSNNMCCTYTPLGDDTVLVLNIGPHSKMYKDTEKVIGKYNQTISQIKSEKAEIIKEKVMQQQPLRQEINKTLEGGIHI